MYVKHMYLYLYMFMFICCVQIAHAVWMGRWNPRHDKEPSKKEEVAFKEFLIAKYERKQWYRDPAEVKKEKEKETSAPAPEPKLLPPPSVKVKAICNGLTTYTCMYNVTIPQLYIVAKYKCTCT